MFPSFLQRLQNTDLFSSLRESSYTYLIILSLHIASLAFFGGMLLVTELRCLGLGMRSYSVVELVNGLRVPKRFGLILAVASGALMFGSQAVQYAHNPWFWTKIALLLLIAVNTLIFRRGFSHKSPAEPERAEQIPARMRVAAGLSLLLWIGVVCAGHGPATVKDIMHSMVDPNGDFLFQSVEEIADAQGIHEKAPKSDAEWEDVRRHLAVLRDTPKLLEGRRAARPRDRSRNPQSESQPEEIQKALEADPAAFIRRARRLRDAADLAIQAAEVKDKDALLHSIEDIDKACENCHLHYWYPNDKRAQEAAKEEGITDY